jgi:hypothetical protein
MSEPKQGNGGFVHGIHKEITPAVVKGSVNPTNKNPAPAPPPPPPPPSNKKDGK